MSDLNQVETAPEKQNDPIDESPTFATVKRIRHLTFAPTPIEIPKKPKEKSKKKKKKTPPTETQETDVTKEKTVTFHETKKKKKKSKHKREKSNGDTPKFGNKAMKLSNMSNFSEVMGGSTMIMDPENNKGENNEALDPDAVILSLPKNEKYKEDVMLGFNVTSYLRSKHIPIGNKVFYALVISIFIASCVMNLWDLILYARTTCPDDFSGVAMYIDFIIILFAKVGIFNYFTSELNANLTYDLKFPFIIPILSVGVIANLQLPLVLYNYNTCAMRSELLQLSFGYFVVNVAAILVAVAFFSAIVSMIFFQKFRVSKETKKMAKTVIYFIGISLMLLMNALFLFVSFTQTKYFSLTLITENITYWSLVVSGVIIFILRKKCNILVFRSLPEADEDLKQDEQSPKFIKPVKPEIVIHQPISVALNEPAHEVAIGIPIETPPHIKANTLHIHKQPLEQIEENSYENETDNSPTMTVFAAMKKAKDGEDGQASAYEGQDFTINCIQIPKNVIEEVEEGEQNNADIERGI